MMTHNVHILLGDIAEQNMRLIYEYVIKSRTEYATENGRNVTDFLQFLLVKDDGDIVRAKHEEAADFITGIEEGYKIEMEPVGAIDAQREELSLSRFFRELFSNAVNVQSPGDGKLHISFHVPMFDTKFWDLTKKIIGGITASRINCTIEAYLESSDLYHIYGASPDNIYEYEEAQKSVLKDALSYDRSSNGLSLILMQNINKRGISLNLNVNSYANLVGEVALAVTLNYIDIFSNGLRAKGNDGVFGVGLSMLNFDRYYFVQYLLRRAYLYVLEREQVNKEKVDVNAVSNRAQAILASNVNVFSNFYKTEVRKLLELGHTHEVIVAEITPMLEKMLQQMEARFTDYIDDEEMSLPEKRATLSQLLGEDDSLLSGEMYNQNQLIVDDCQCEAMDVFIEANNKLLEVPNDELGEDNRPIISHAVLSGANPQAPHPTARMMVDDIKKVKIAIKQNTEYIRTTTSLLEKLDESIAIAGESKKCLTKDGFVFNGVTYRLLPDNIEKPLEETIEFTVRDLPTTIDLRRQFTPIKSQGPLGACTVFALTSVFEYILKKNSNENSDLSEHFVYYNTLKEKGQLEEYGKVGTSHFDVVKSIGTDGICLESLCEYTGDFETSKPSDEAYEDAKGRKITKAMNVRIDLEQIKAALSEGYPVVVGLRVFDSLATTTGFVCRPTDEELQEEEGWHSMVICGYSDKEKVFIVRNSWGTDFGDNGYCYIPYSYVCDAALCHQATVVTEVGIANVVVAGTDKQLAVSFNEADARIQAAIYRILIDEEKVALTANQSLYEKLEGLYRAVVASIGRYGVRQELQIGTEERLKYERRKLVEQKEQVSKERRETLDAFDEETTMTWWGLGLTVATIVVVVGVLVYFLGIKDVLFTKFNYWTTCIEVLCLGLFFWEMKRRKEERFRLEQDFKLQLQDVAMECNEREKELEITKLKMHIAGVIHNILTPFVVDLRNMHEGMRSYVNNLREWYKDLVESEDVPLVQEVPFRTVIVPSYLSEYFDNEAEDLTSEIRLYRLFSNGLYKVEEQQIVEFKQNVKNILAKEIFDKVSDFSLYDYVSGKMNYGYLPNNEARENNVKSELKILDDNSTIFVRTCVDNDGCETIQKCLFCKRGDATQNTTGADDRTICEAFGTMPMVYDLLSNYKMFMLRLETLEPAELDVLS